MSNLIQLKQYLITENYLFKEENNGKVIMLSGRWGAGKTHFWKNQIEPNLTRLKEYNKAYVYISGNPPEKPLFSKVENSSKI